MERCEAKSEEVAYYVRLARSYSTQVTGTVESAEAPVRTAWD
jgi:hypothetical protein